MEDSIKKAFNGLAEPEREWKYKIGVFCSPSIQRVGEDPIDWEYGSFQINSILEIKEKLLHECKQALERSLLNNIEYTIEYRLLSINGDRGFDNGGRGTPYEHYFSIPCLFSVKIKANTSRLPITQPIEKEG